MSDNQQRARDLLTVPHPGTDINPYWRVDMLAAALDAAEARGRVEALAKVEALHSPVDHGTGPQCQGCATSVTFTRWPCKTIAVLRGEHRYDPDTCRCTCGALDHPEWGVTA